MWPIPALTKGRPVAHVCTLRPLWGQPEKEEVGLLVTASVGPSQRGETRVSRPYSRAGNSCTPTGLWVGTCRCPIVDQTVPHVYVLNMVFSIRFSRSIIHYTEGGTRSY